MSLGGKFHGHLALCIDSHEYQTRTGHAFVVPHNKGKFPPTIPANAMEMQISTNNEQWSWSYNIFHNCNNVHKALKKKLIKAVDTEYIYVLDNKVLGSKNVVLANIIICPYKMYGRISKSDLKNNNIIMICTYNASKPFCPL